MISKDLTTFFKNAHHALSFIHVPAFLKFVVFSRPKAPPNRVYLQSQIARPQNREKMQPSLVLSVLALSAIMQAWGGRKSRMELALVCISDLSDGTMERPLTNPCSSFSILGHTLRLRLPSMHNGLTCHLLRQRWYVDR